MGQKTRPSDPKDTVVTDRKQKGIRNSEIARLIGRIRSI